MASTVARPLRSVPLAVGRPDRIAARRYYDAEFYELECEHLWPHVWQMACRLEEIPNPGDFVEYKILDQSVIVVRDDAGEVRTFHNACRHRAVALVEDRGTCQSGFTCPFHGWCFGLDGESTWVYQTSLFDGGNLDTRDLALVPCRVDTWGGCAFINFDDDAPGLRESIEPFASYHDLWQIEHLRAEKWFAAELPVNWKLAVEAFMEGYHVNETHWQLPTPGTTGKNALYRISDGVIPPEGVPQPTFPDGPIDRLAFIDRYVRAMRLTSEGMAGMTDIRDVRIAEGLRNIELPPDPAEAYVEFRRRLHDEIMTWHRNTGAVMPDLHEIEARRMNSPVNFCFPNFFLLPMYSAASSYRARPLGPERTLFEIWSLFRQPQDAERDLLPTPVPMAPDNQRWPPIPAQDFSNLPRQQRGLHTKGFEYMRLSKHVEGLISNYQRLIDGHLEGRPQEQLLQAVHLVNGPIDQPVKDLGL